MALESGKGVCFVSPRGWDRPHQRRGRSFELLVSTSTSSPKARSLADDGTVQVQTAGSPRRWMGLVCFEVRGQTLTARTVSDRGWLAVVMQSVPGTGSALAGRSWDERDETEEGGREEE